MNIELKKNKKLYFASDFHLGIPNEKNPISREKKICRWLDVIKKDAQVLFLLGDIFDYWFEYKHVINKGYIRLLGKLAELSDIGIQIYIFKGNHDTWYADYLEKQINAIIIADDFQFICNNKTFYLHHGDGLYKKEKSYNLLRFIFRNKYIIWCFSRLHPNFATYIAQMSSKKSRLANASFDNKFLGEDKEYQILFCKDYLKKSHKDYFILGHRHYANDISLVDNSRYINLGEWVYNATYAYFDGNDVTLTIFNEDFIA